MNNANYILVCYDVDGNEVFVRGGSEPARYHFYTRKMAVKALGKAIECLSVVQCAKIYRRRRSGGYSWVATRVRGGAHFAAWGE